MRLVEVSGADAVEAARVVPWMASAGARIIFVWSKLLLADLASASAAEGGYSEDRRRALGSIGGACGLVGMRLRNLDSIQYLPDEYVMHKT